MKYTLWYKSEGILEKIEKLYRCNLYINYTELEEAIKEEKG